jgi:tellurite resistance protein TehA-like permease
VIVVILLLIGFFAFILIFPILGILLLVSIKDPKLLQLFLYFLFASVGFLYEKTIEGIDLWHDLPEDSKQYDSKFIHYLRFMLLTFIILFVMVLTYSLVYLVSTVCLGDSSTDLSISQISNRNRRLKALPYGSLLF